MEDAGEEKTFDFKPVITMPVFKPLKDEKVCRGVYIDYGWTAWNDGDIDSAIRYSS